MQPELVGIPCGKLLWNAAKRASGVENSSAYVNCFGSLLL
jgi:hypothetical protein